MKKSIFMMMAFVGLSLSAISQQRSVVNIEGIIMEADQITGNPAEPIMSANEIQSRSNFTASTT